MAAGLFWLCSISIVISAVIADVAGDQTKKESITPCNQNRLKECKGENYVVLGKDIIPDLSDTELNQICQDWTSSQQPCLQDLAVDCKLHNETDPELLRSINQAILELTEGRNFICDPENKYAYVADARPCLEREGGNLTMAGEACFKDYHNHTWFLNTTKKMNTFEFCKYANLYLSCQDELIEDKCGKKAQKWTSEYHLILWKAHMDSISCRREKAGLEAGAIATISLCAGAAIYCIFFSAASLIKESDKCKCAKKSSKNGYQQADTESK